jgi:FkbM family methyltransferase
MKKIKAFIKGKISRLKEIVWNLSRPEGVDLLLFAHQEMGISNFGDSETTGEKYVVERVLKKYIPEENAILFDVGANVGEYTELLNKYFPKAKIFSFEPNKKIHAILEKKFQNNKNTTAENLGLGSLCEQGNKLFSYKLEKHTRLGTSHRKMLEEVYVLDDEIEEIEFVMDTLDGYCEKQNIQKIDFLKVDVEGGELDVLKGAKTMLDEGRIKIVQFEFNEHNVFSKVFLYDFYQILEKYDLYRIKNHHLIPLDGYSTINEIFRYQNILAIQKGSSD